MPSIPGGASSIDLGPLKSILKRDRKCLCLCRELKRVQSQNEEELGQAHMPLAIYRQLSRNFFSSCSCELSQDQG